MRRRAEGKRVPGPDIFLSYNREDSARAKHFADGFSAEGLDVWWDVALRSGEAYDKVTEDALRKARAVVVLWSPRSVESRWVRAEATLADRRKVLMPAMIEPCERPIMFELVQTADLIHWRGDLNDPVWCDFCRHVREFIGKETAPEPARPSEPLPSLNQISIAVLPFLNMGGDPEQDYFADGITEDVITDLSKVSALKVIARNTAFTFKGRNVDVRDVARQLNVTHVLEGSIRKAGNRVRVTAQLIDGADQSHIWADRWDRELDDIFELQDELSAAIVEALKVNLLPKEKKAIKERCCANLEAYDLYLRARALNIQIGTDTLTSAIALLRRVIELDPGFLQAHAALAAALENSTTIMPEGADEAWAEIAEIESRLADMAPNDPATLVCRASLQGHRYEFEEATKTISRLPEGYRDGPFWTFPGVHVAFMGRYEEALAAQREQARLDPLGFLHSLTLSDFLEITGRIEEAQAEDDRSLNIAGNRGYIEFRIFLRGKGAATREEQAGQYQRFLEVRGPEMRIELFDALAPVVHDREAAMKLVRAAIADPRWQDTTRQIWFAFLAGYYDAPDDCLTALRNAYVERHPAFGILLYLWWPVMREAHLDPRFKDILRDMGLYDYWRKTGKWGDFVRPVGDDDFEVVFP
ncbi:MAG TPA: TIR domain-containing protein [Sphingomonadaceae bacterium]|nr:TIR domain-containing protein [Sphingomonadaceae bacterium]